MYSNCFDDLEPEDDSDDYDEQASDEREYDSEVYYEGVEVIDSTPYTSVWDNVLDW